MCGKFVTLKVFGLTQKTNFAAHKIAATKVAGGAISTESASEADSSDQQSQIRLAIKNDRSCL